ncbi:OB-fold domain-containing protein [Streptomyces sp. OZ13]|uniref:OB-fold domain-containing protein n=1 Tax=Streptomyces sp. OZ13 TaxID=3452210 RepID=UPI003F889D5A
MTDGLYARLKTYEGRGATLSGVGKDLVNEPMIRHWCEAMGDRHPAYAGPDAVAPPTMLQAWTMGGLSGHTGRNAAHDELFELLDEAGCTSVVATDCEQEYLRPLRPGDRITFDSVIESVSEHKTTKLGTGYFITTRMDVRAGGEPAGRHRFRILKYAPRNRQPKEGRPRPVINRDNAGFWEGVADRRLLIQRCGGCGKPRFPWLPGCGACGSPHWDTLEACGSGSVFSYVVMHHPPFPAFDPPYAVGLIELAEGVRMVSSIVGVPPDKVRIGMPVELEFLGVGGEYELPVFRGVPGASADTDSAKQEVSPEMAPDPVAAPGPALAQDPRPAPAQDLRPVADTDPGPAPHPAPGLAPDTAPASATRPDTLPALRVGAALPSLAVPVTRTLIVAGAIASRDFQDVHHDAEIAKEKGSPDIFMNILTTNGLVGRYITDSFGSRAVLRKVSIRLGAPNHPGDTMVLSGAIGAFDGTTAEVRVVGANSLGNHVTGTVTVTIPEAAA